MEIVQHVLQDLIDETANREGTKTIFIGNTMDTKRKKNEKKQKPPKPPSNRVITKEKKWIQEINENDTKIETQDQLLHNIEDLSKKQTIILREIKNKIRGYKQQDVEKQKYNQSQFVPLDFVVNLLQQDSKCYYCRNPTKILYSQSRDPSQWTLERIDNTKGHNCDNVKICCLSCNIKRRTMYHEKYLFTKQLILKKDK